MFEHQAGKSGIKTFVIKRKRTRPRLHVARPTAPLDRNRNLCRRRINPGHRTTGRRQRPRYLTVSGADVENRRNPCKFSHHERNDLVFIFRVGAVGETINPPLSMLFPQTAR